MSVNTLLRLRFQPLFSHFSAISAPFCSYIPAIICHFHASACHVSTVPEIPSSIIAFVLLDTRQKAVTSHPVVRYQSYHIEIESFWLEWVRGCRWSLDVESLTL